MKKIICFLILALVLPVSLITAQQPAINLRETPFSYYGSWMAFSVKPDNNGRELLYLRDISGNFLGFDSRIFSLEMDTLMQTFSANSALIDVQSSSGRFSLTYQDANTIQIKGNGGPLIVRQILEDIASLYIPVRDNQWRLQMGGHCHYVLTVLKGTGQIKGSRNQIRAERKPGVPVKSVVVIEPDASGNFEIALEQYFIGWKNSSFEDSFEACLAKSKTNFSEWLKNSPSVPGYLTDAGALAAYIDWSCVVSPRGEIKRTIMYSSKNYMIAIWAWDHCFYAMSAAYHLPDFAWDNFIHLFDHQDQTGGIPDYITDRNMMWGFLKPPIHGWTLREMDRVNPKILTPERTAEAYQALTKWTNFWFTYMDDDHDSIPQYNHGNDSGWDNATVFDMGFPAEAPDLCAYLVIQMDFLADLALRQGMTRESAEWKIKADRLLDRMIKTFWTGERFVTRRGDDNGINENNMSLMGYLPLVLGDRLPKEISDKMIRDLKGKGSNLTKIGLASENVHSALYKEDGYWRGPVWAASTLIICSGLRANGEEALAREIADRFCRNCMINGFGETFDAVTGKSQRDISLPWSSAIFLILAHEYLK